MASSSTIAFSVEFFIISGEIGGNGLPRILMDLIFLRNNAGYKEPEFVPEIADLCKDESLGTMMDLTYLLRYIAGYDVPGMPPLNNQTRENNHDGYGF